MTSRHDVRMRGFQSRSTVDSVLAWIDQHSLPLPAEEVSIDDSSRRVLAVGVVSPMNVPPFDRSAMDGYALHADETVGAGDYNPLPFQVIGDSLPGRPFERIVASGQAVRIMTGAPIPSGADAVVPAEFTSLRSHADGTATVEITAPIPTLRNIGRTGEDVSAGSTLLQAGRRLRPQDVGLIASVGAARVSVVRQPRVRIVITGDELAEPGEQRSEFQIFEVNSRVISGLVQRDGGTIESRVRCRDDRDAIQAAVAAPGADVILISGGSSVGSEDHAPNIIRDMGELPFHGVAMRPSSPAGVGRIGDTFVCLLPGNPVSCLCAYDFFAGRIIRRLGGCDSDWPYQRIRGTLTARIISQIGRVDYCRVQVTAAEVSGEAVAAGSWQITPLALSGASILSSTVRANGFAVIPGPSEGCPAGAEIEVYLYG